MRGAREASRLVAWLAVAGQLALLAGCHQTIDGAGSSGAATSGNLVAGVLGSNDIGEAIFQLYRGKLQNETNTSVRTAELGALDAQHQPFVQAVNEILNIQALQNGVQSAKDLFSLVDDGTFPNLAADGAQILTLLENDPAAQSAVLSLLQQSNRAPIIPVGDVITLLGRMINYSQTPQLWQATSDIVSANPTLVHDLLALGSKRLQAATTPGPTSGTLGAVGQKLASAILDPANYRAGSVNFGTPVFIVVLDDRGIAQVATRSTTGSFVTPFVDDGTGHAKVDAQGGFIDASGAPITIVPFGAPNTPGFDSDGLAVTPTGEFYFVYLDAKTTILALDLKLAGDLLRANAHQQAFNVLEAALGPQKSDGSYNDGPVPDLAFGALELLAPDTAPQELRAFATLLENDPTRGEQILVTISRLIADLQQAHQQSAQAGGLASLSLSDPQMVQLTDNLLPLIDEVSTIPSSGGSSATRALIDVLHDLNQTDPGWGAKLAPLVTMHRISPAVAVDYSHPATYVDSSGTTVDNRSSTHQLLDLLAVTDKCQLPILNESLAQFILETMAGLTPATVGSLANLISSLPPAIQNLLCAGVSNDVQSLTDLANSGSLDALLPITKAFKDRGEIPLLVKILVTVDQSYNGTFRQTEPDLNKVLASGALDEIAGLLGESTTITDPQSGRSLADILSDAAATFVDQHSSHVLDRHGNQVPSLAYLLLYPLRALDQTLRAANVGSDLSSLSSTFVSLFLARTTDPQTGQEILANGSTVPFALKVLRAFADGLPSDTATRRSDLTQAEQGFATFVLSSDMGTIVNLYGTILNAPSRPLIDTAVVNLLTPNPSTPDDIFGAVIKLAAVALQHIAQAASVLQGNAQSLTDLEHFAGQALDPQQTFVQDMISGVNRILTVDQGQTILNVEKAALNPPAGSNDAPATVLINIVQGVNAAAANANGGSTPALTQATLQADLAAAVAWINNQQSGLGQLFTLIKNRTK